MSGLTLPYSSPSHDLPHSTIWSSVLKVAVFNAWEQLPMEQIDGHIQKIKDLGWMLLLKAKGHQD